MDNDKLTPETEPDLEPETESDAATPDEANEPEAEIVAEAQAEAADDDLDIDAALAAVASLSDVLAAQESEAEQPPQTSEFTAVDVTPPPAIQEQRSSYFPSPPPSTLPRGSMASVVPAFVLIGIGVWLTFALSTGYASPAAAAGSGSGWAA
ncbi:MAG: hypothetical protein U0694_01925 [Anaerolineae bacterium]